MLKNINPMLLFAVVTILVTGIALFIRKSFVSSKRPSDPPASVRAAKSTLKSREVHTDEPNKTPKKKRDFGKWVSRILGWGVAAAIIFGIGSCAFTEIRKAQNFSNSVRREYIEVPSVYNEKRVWVKNNEPYTLYPDCKRWDVGTLGSGDYKVVYPQPNGDSIVVEAPDVSYENHIEIPSYPDACGHPWIRLYPMNADSVRLWVKTIP